MTSLLHLEVKWLLRGTHLQLPAGSKHVCAKTAPTELFWLALCQLFYIFLEAFMLNLLINLMPTMCIILAGYIIIFARSLQKFLGLKRQREIIAIGVTYFLLAILGFLLIYQQIQIGIPIWLILVILLTLALIYFTIQARKHR